MHQIVIDISNILVKSIIHSFCSSTKCDSQAILIIKNKDLHLYTCLSMCISLMIHNI